MPYISKGYMAQYKDPAYLEREIRRVGREPSCRHQFNVGAYHLCVPSEEQDPEILRGMDILAGRATHTINRMIIIMRQDLSFGDVVMRGNGNFERLLEKIKDPIEGLDAVPDMFKTETAERYDPNYESTRGLRSRKR